MEQLRLLIAIVLSFAVFFVWEVFIVKRKPVTPPEETAAVSQPKESTSPVVTPPPVATPTPVTAAPEMEEPSEPGREPRLITVKTPFYTASLSEMLASVKSFALKDYRETVEPDSPMKELIETGGKSRMLGLGFAENSVPGLAKAVFTASVDDPEITVSDQPRSIDFSWTSKDGVTVVKRFTFRPDTYLIGMNVSIVNQSGKPLDDNLTVSIARLFDHKSKKRYAFEGPSAYIGKHLQKIKPDDIGKNPVLSGQVTWLSMEDRYFMATVIPKDAEKASINLEHRADGMAESTFVQPMPPVAPGSSAGFEYELYFGPKQLELLTRLGHNLDSAIDFGWFDILAKPCLWFMNFIHGFIPNYGIAIIILTIFTKIILWPLGTKSYGSMNQMKKLQPLVAEMREKYKDDKKRQNEEMMNLYKTYKVNPMGGCLPMVVQIPIFIALYRMLYEAIELRHAPFFGWINDLSAPDRLFHFDFSIPFMEAPYGIPVLTIVMGATMLIQQKMSPPPGDPSQAKMMMLMPIVFTFIFINFPAGLVIYWLVNNVFSIAQQYYVQKKNA